MCLTLRFSDTLEKNDSDYNILQKKKTLIVVIIVPGYQKEKNSSTTNWMSTTQPTLNLMIVQHGTLDAKTYMNQYQCK